MTGSGVITDVANNFKLSPVVSSEISKYVNKSFISQITKISGREYSHAENSLAHVHGQMHASGPRCDAIKDPFVPSERRLGWKIGHSTV